MTEIREAAADLDVSDVNAIAWNRLACGMLDCPSEVELTPAAILAVTAAESIALTEYARWLTLER